MLMNNRPVAPHIGCWQLTMHSLPPIGVTVLGIGWCAETNFPAVAFLHWDIVDDPESFDENLLFRVGNEDGEEEYAAWFKAFSDDVAEPVQPPCAWAETRFVIPLPAKVCEDCSGLVPDSEDGGCCGIGSDCEDDDG